MAVHHPHVGAVAVEPDHIVRARAEAGVIVTRHANVVLELREAAGATEETLWNGRHLGSDPAPYA